MALLEKAKQNNDQCGRCGKYYDRKLMIYISCEGVFCPTCNHEIMESIFEGPFEYEDNGLNKFVRE